MNERVFPGYHELFLFLRLRQSGRKFKERECLYAEAPSTQKKIMHMYAEVAYVDRSRTSEAKVFFAAFAKMERKIHRICL